jgi:hypothetical protein
MKLLIFFFKKTRIKNSDINQSLLPFSKKSVFYKGISTFFKSTEKNPDAMASSSMKGGGLEAQRAPDLLFQLLFAIGTQGIIIPNKKIGHPANKDNFPNMIYVNPTEVIINCMIAVLEACWCVRLTTVPLDINHIKAIQDVMNTSHTRLQELFTMKQWLLGSDKIFLSGKSHACCHIPRQMCSLGPHVLNDTDQGESAHVMDKVDYRRTSKRYSETNSELARLVMRGIRSQTMLSAYNVSKPSINCEQKILVPKYRTFDRKIQMWVFECNDIQLCPLLLSLSSLTSLFVDYANLSDDNRSIIVDLMRENRNEYCMCMCKGITFVTDEFESGMATFRVYATVDFKENKGRYDFVEVGFKDDSDGLEVCVCQVLGIFAVSKHTELSTPTMFILLVTTMKECIKKGNDRLLPYSLLGYDFPPNCINVNYHMINADTVLRPYIGIRDADRKWNCRGSTKKNLSEKRFWGIRLATTDRGTGYGDANTVQALPSLTKKEMANIHLQLREQGNTARRRSSDESVDGDFSESDIDDLNDDDNDDDDVLG